MKYEDAFDIAFDVVKNEVKSVLETNYLVVDGVNFRISPSFDRSCMVWMKPNENSGYRCIGSADFIKCKDFNGIKRQIACRIANALAKKR